MTTVDAVNLIKASSCGSKRLQGAVFRYTLDEFVRGPKDKSAHYRSKAAIGVRWSRKLIYEHAIPLKVLFPLPFENALELYVPVLITKEEDARLSAAGLKSRMPKGWKVGNDPLARYRKVGIEIVENSPEVQPQTKRGVPSAGIPAPAHRLP